MSSLCVYAQALWPRGVQGLGDCPSVGDTRAESLVNLGYMWRVYPAHCRWLTYQNSLVSPWLVSWSLACPQQDLSLGQTLPLIFLSSLAIGIATLTDFAPSLVNLAWQKQ